MNTVDKIQMRKLLQTLESRVKQAQGSDAALLVRLNEVKNALNGVVGLYPNDKTLTESAVWIDKLVETMEQKSEVEEHDSGFTN